MERMADGFGDQRVPRSHDVGDVPTGPMKTAGPPRGKPAVASKNRT